MSADLNENTEFNINIKTIIAICAGILSVAGVYFTLIAQLQHLEVQLMRMEAELNMNSEFRIKWPRGEMGSLPADSEQFMLIEDLYKQTEKLTKNQEMNTSNKLRIEFMEKQVAKMLQDIEKLKDQNREIKFGNGNGKTH